MPWNPFNVNHPWSPLHELQRIQSDMDRLFRTWPGESAAREHPRINLWSGESGMKLCAELPGLDPSDIDVAVVGDTVTLKGEIADAAPETGEVHRRERRTGKFVRSFQLPFEIEGGEVEARFKNGVLEVDLPRARAQRPRRIAVKNA
jgi:HSP20 family protein